MLQCLIMESYIDSTCLYRTPWPDNAVREKGNAPGPRRERRVYCNFLYTACQASTCTLCRKQCSVDCGLFYLWIPIRIKQAAHSNRMSNGPWVRLSVAASIRYIKDHFGLRDSVKALKEGG